MCVDIEGLLTDEEVSQLRAKNDSKELDGKFKTVDEALADIDRRADEAFNSFVDRISRDRDDYRNALFVSYGFAAAMENAWLASFLQDVLKISKE